MFLWMSQYISVNSLGVIVTELSVDVYVRSGAEISIFTSPGAGSRVSTVRSHWLSILSKSVPAIVSVTSANTRWSSGVTGPVPIPLIA